MSMSLGSNGIGMTDIIETKIQAAAMAAVQEPVAKSMANSTNVTSACTLVDNIMQHTGKKDITLEEYLTVFERSVEIIKDML